MKIKLPKENYESIVALIAEKSVSDPSKQKGIREKIRLLGFRYENFYGKTKVKGGYTKKHLDLVIERGLIEII